MLWTSKISPLLKEVELRKPPIIVKVNKFTEDSAKKFHQEMAAAHNSGQPVIPIVIDSYGGQVYSLMSMISAIHIRKMINFEDKKQRLRSEEQNAQASNLGPCHGSLA